MQRSREPGAQPVFAAHAIDIDAYHFMARALQLVTGRQREA